MAANQAVKENSPAVQAHLSILQSVIQRMASNSASCKSWCITIVSAVLVIVADKGKYQFAAIALIPLFLFLGLDTYYLALEIMFRDSYNTFIEKLHRKTLTVSDLYAVSPQGKFRYVLPKSFKSFSVWPFYLVLLVMICIAAFYVIRSGAPETMGRDCRPYH